MLSNEERERINTIAAWRIVIIIVAALMIVSGSCAMMLVNADMQIKVYTAKADRCMQDEEACMLKMD